MNPRASRGTLAVLLVLLFLPLLSVSGPAPPLHGAPAASPGPLVPAAAAPVQPSAALLSFAVVSSTPQAQPKDPVAFTVYFNNTGNQNAPSAWINVSAASGFTFVGDTAAGNVSGYPDYAFANVPLGLHSFRMTFLVNVGVAPGSRLAVSATLVYADGTGGKQFLGPASGSVLVGVVTKQLYLGWGTLTPGILTPVVPTGSLVAAGTFTLTPGGAAVNFDLTPALARSFRSLNASAVLYLQPVSPAALDLNLTLIDVNGGATAVVSSVERTYTVTGSGYWTLFYTFPSMNYAFAAGHQIRLQVLSTLASGQAALLATNATTMPSRVSFQTPSYVTITSLRPTLVPATYLSPMSTLVVTANVTDPFGSSEVLAAHLNVSGPAGAVSGWASPFPVLARDPSTPSAWVVFQQSFSPLLANGTYAVEATAVERSGVVTIADGGAFVRAPRFSLQKVASPNQGKTGTRITYFVWYNNTGTGPAARVWLNDTLPSQVNFLNSSVTATSVSGSVYAWILNNVPVGAHVLQIFVQVRGGISTVSYIRNWATLNYTDPQGFLWPALKSHADIVINGPALGLSQTSNPSALIHSNQPVVFSIHIMNSGDAAATLWVNDTLPAGLTYVSDSVVGGTRSIVGNGVHWTFPGMPSGATTPTYLNFTMTARAAAGLGWGLTLRNTIGLNDTSTNGVLMPDLLSLHSLTVASPSITSASAGFGVAAAVPNVALPLYVNFTNGGNEASGTAWINLTLNPSLRLVNGSGVATLAGSVLRIQLASAALGPDSVRVVLAANATVRDRDVLSAAGSLVVLDGYGNLLAPVSVAPGTVTVALPKVGFTVTPPSASLEAGTSTSFTVTGGNSGTGTASAVWLNLTLPAGLAYVADTFGTQPIRVSFQYSWVFRPYAPGPRTYTLVLAGAAGAADNTTAAFTFSVETFDAGGNAEPVTTFGGQVHILAPEFQLSAWSEQNRTQVSTDPFAITLTATNTGSTMAQTLWLTTTPDSHVTVISYDASVSATGSAPMNWTFHDVTPGQTIVIVLHVRVNDGTPGNAQIVEVLGASYTNSGGTVLGSVPPASMVVYVQPNWAGLLEILLGGSAIGGLLIFVVYRRYRVEIEDVFLIYRDGILVSHLTEGNHLEKDEDQLSGMLTAVQDFVKDAFTYGEHRELHQLEFGDYHVLIERGKVVYLAVVYRGRDSGLIRKRVRTVLDRVESAYGGVFDTWDGDVAQVSGTWDLLREGFVEDKHPWSLVKSRTT